VHLLRHAFDLDRADTAICGAKAAHLGALSRRGYAVPPAIVVTTLGYEAFLRENGLTRLVEERGAETETAGLPRLMEIGDEIAAAFAAARLPSEVADELEAWTAAAGTAAFAVRSSATNEDLPGATFAGQYVSELDVASSDVPSRIARCFASLFNARVALYRRRRGIARIGAMAVIVEEMVPSEVAGVVFTDAPRRENALLIECAPGLGEAVVSGTVTPDRYVVDRATLTADVDGGCLDRARIRHLARIALAIERDFDGPQDIEFGIVRDVVFILQARPIAASTLAAAR
jgi:rifampicin phosphotransferase